jgi:hypothetical protein
MAMTFRVVPHALKQTFHQKKKKHTLASAIYIYNGELIINVQLLYHEEDWFPYHTQVNNDAVRDGYRKHMHV